MAELTWENGQLTMHGLGLPRVPSKSNLASGTLESIVNQATKKLHPGGACDVIPDTDLAPWFDPPSAPASVSVSMDALVPTANTGSACGVGCSTTRVGSCGAAASVPLGSDWSGSASESTRMRRDTCQQMSGGGNGLTSTSPESTKTATFDDHDSVCHSHSQSQVKTLFSLNFFFFFWVGVFILSPFNLFFPPLITTMLPSIINLIFTGAQYFRCRRSFPLFTST